MTHSASPERPELGVVVPTLNEEHALPRLLDDLESLPLALRIVVADGGSLDRTVEIARTAGARTITSPPGRATQMNAGARAADTPWLLFLHADSRIPSETGSALAGWLNAPSACEAAHFSFRLDTNRRWRAVIEGGQRVRERLTGLAYGDQGLILSRRRFDEIGGIPELPIMEDVETIRRLRRSGGVARIEAPIVTSARRYLDEGPLAAWIRNALMIVLYSAGVAPERLARWYPARGTAVHASVPDPTPGTLPHAEP